MNIDKLTEQILEITNNSDYGWICLGSAEADRIRKTLTAALTTPAVVERSEQLQGFFEFYKQKFGGGFNADVLEITLRQYQETL